MNTEDQGAEQADVERRLAAILASDVVGYSRLMEADEAGTLARLRSVRQELIDPGITKCKGRVIKTTGDGMLVEFQSVIEAVRCAADFQRSMALRNEGPNGGLLYRIGINIGDVIVENGDIFGDGVNVAARLESIAEPGGICVSAAVREQVGDRLDVGFEDLGEHTVKNISRPIRIFRVRLDGKKTGVPAAAGAARPKETPARVPSIAVLPFVNMSGDPDQEFFADGLTEDIITEVSRFRDLLVISRNAVFVHKGKAVTARGIAREFGVNYVVEGSVRKATDRVRVTVQLIDGETETHIWAERYDRKLEDIFAIQDEVTAAIVGTLRGRVEAATHDRAKKKPTDNMAAYEYVLAGKVLHHRSERGANEEALAMLERALALDPMYAHAHAWKACVLGQRFVHGWYEDVNVLLAAITRELETALSLDETDATCIASWRRCTSPSIASTRRFITRSGRSSSRPTTTSSSSSKARSSRGSAGPRKASSGSARPCASTRTIRSDSGVTWGGRSTSRAPMATRFDPSAASPSRTTRTSPSLLPRRRSWAMPALRQPTRER